VEQAAVSRDQRRPVPAPVGFECVRLQLYLAVVATSSGSSGATAEAGLGALGDAKAACIFDNLFKICSCLERVQIDAGDASLLMGSIN
jgi:hypothetical protein